MGLGSPLVVTPLLAEGRAADAREKAAVDPAGLAGVPSYSMFFEVDADLGSHTYAWYFPALNRDPGAPLLLWLQGGPGGASTFGALNEIGPVSLSQDADSGEISAVRRDANWARNCDLLFLDNPVGTGFSYTGSDAGYATKRADYEATLFEALQQFYAMFPEKLGSDFYITGESYAGKYIPALGHKIHEENARGARVRIPLKGLAIGDGWSDPLTMVPRYGDMLEQFSLVDARQAQAVRKASDTIVADIEAEQYKDAFLGWDRLINGDKTGPSFVQNVTGLKNYFNLLSPDYPGQDLWDQWLDQAATRELLHVGDAELHDGSKVESFIVEDIMRSVKPYFPVLLENYKVLVYSGQLDVIVGAPLTTAFLNSIDWTGAAEFEAAERVIWVGPDAKVAGYVHGARNLLHVVVRNAGHLVPSDQPVWALDMISRFVGWKSFGATAAPLPEL